MINRFINYLRYERNLSPLTLEHYEHDLNDFQTYFKERDNHLCWQATTDDEISVDADIIRDWMESMMDKGNKATSINRRLSALRSFYRFAIARGLVGHDPAHTIHGPKKNKPLPVYVREGDLDQLIDRPEMWNDDYQSVRARTIIILLYETGIRVSELTGLNNVSVDFSQHQLKVTGKRNKQRIVPFGDELEAVLQTYIHVRNEYFGRLPVAGEPLLLNDHGNRMTYAQVYKIVKQQLGKVTTQKKRSPHVLRHSFATAMLNHEAGLESVRKLLGHESVATTEIYTHTTFEQLKRVYKNAHPRA